MVAAERRGAREPLDLLAEMNERIYEVATRAQLRAGDRWHFRCECSDPDCMELVPLSLSRYAALTQNGGAVLAPGHRPSKSRKRRELVEEGRRC
jgi:hypothetical protein